MKKKHRLKIPKRPSQEYQDVWRIVDGAIKKAFDAHPNYLTLAGARYKTARMSIAKRVVGDVVSYLDRKARVEQSGKTGC
jgi:hypothetical protein